MITLSEVEREVITLSDVDLDVIALFDSDVDDTTLVDTDRDLYSESSTVIVTDTSSVEPSG